MTEKVLIIYAHPNKKGHSGEYLKVVEEKLKSDGKEYEIIDLYAIKYDPCLNDEEHYTSGGHEVSAQNKEFQEKISNTTRLIFIYPIWWQNMPAILKGFVDRIFVSRYAYRFQGRIPIALLKGKKAIALTSSGGPRIYTKLIKCDRGIKVLTKDTLEFCGIKSRGYNVGGANKFTDENKEKIRKIVDRGIRFLE